jgi:hypothetical protein
VYILQLQGIVARAKNAITCLHINLESAEDPTKVEERKQRAAWVAYRKLMAEGKAQKAASPPPLLPRTPPSSNCFQACAAMDRGEPP